MSTKYNIFETNNITIFGDVFEEKTVFIKVENLKNVSFYLENNISNMKIGIQSEDFLNICKNYIKYIEKHE